MPPSTEIHNALIYWFYKFVVFGILMFIDLIVGFQVITTFDSGLLVGFILLSGFTVGVFFAFQAKFKKMYIFQKTLVFKGFFYGQFKLDFRSVKFQERRLPLSMGLVELTVKNMESGKSFRVITDQNGISVLKRLIRET